MLTHCSFAYSALACFKMKMSGSASFHCAQKILVRRSCSGPVTCESMRTRKTQWASASVGESKARPRWFSIF